MKNNRKISIFQLIFGILFIGMAVEIVFLIKQNNQLRNIVEKLTHSDKYEKGLKIGTEAPSFSANTIDNDGFDLSNYLGTNQITLIFFSTTCKACVDDVRKWQQIQEISQYNDSKIIGICKASLSDTREYQKNNNINIPVIADSSGTIFKQYDVRYIPYKYVINNQAQIALNSSEVPYQDELTEIAKILTHQLN